MKVELINSPENLIDTLYVCARTCYNAGSPIDFLNEPIETPKEEKIHLLKKCIESGHLSPLEHANFTFAIEGITRACSHQLVRHRLCSFSQQSQRYVNMQNGFKYDIPKTISKSLRAGIIFEELMQQIQKTYNDLIVLGIKAEDARAVLPNACHTNLTMTCNLRELIHIANERLCSRAQTEIRILVKMMCETIVQKEEWLEPYLQPKCAKFGFCPESQSCGRKEKAVK